jgi:hypothetical protein
MFVLSSKLCETGSHICLAHCYANNAEQMLDVKHVRNKYLRMNEYVNELLVQDFIMSTKSHFACTYNIFSV